MTPGLLWQRRQAGGGIVRALAVLAALLLLWACAAPTAPPIAPAEPSASRVAVLLAGGGREDGSLNQLIWQGVTQAQQTLTFVATAQVVEDAAAGAARLPALVAEGYDLILIGEGAVGVEELRHHPEQTFLLVEGEAALPHVHSLTFDLTQPAFLAGYLAAGVSASGAVCTLATEATATRWAVMAAFAAGVEHYNQVWGAEVLLMGWDGQGRQGAVVGSQDEAALLALAAALYDSGCDVLLPLGAADLRPAAALAHGRGRALIGGDIDGYLLAPEWGAVWLTSLQRRGDVMVAAALRDLMAGQALPGMAQVGTLANGGVGLAPLHLWEERTPAALRTELAALQQSLLEGRIPATSAP